MKPHRFLIASCIGLICVSSTRGGKSDFGDCSVEIQVKMNSDGRTLTVLKEAEYIDPNDEHWIAPVNAKVDGASIPQVFWSAIGGPLDGPYRYASVFHDVACNERSHTWQITHQMFYYAMKCSGVEEAKAKLMFYAVWGFGPRWRPPVRGGGVPRRQEVSPEALPDESEVDKIEKWIGRKNTSLEQIETRANSKRR